MSHIRLDWHLPLSLSPSYRWRSTHFNIVDYKFRFSNQYIWLENETEPFKCIFTFCHEMSVLTHMSISLMQQSKIVIYKSHRETHSISCNVQLFANEREWASFLIMLLFIIVNHQRFHLDGFSLSLFLVIWPRFVSFHFMLRVHNIHTYIINWIYL